MILFGQRGHRNCYNAQHIQNFINDKRILIEVNGHDLTTQLLLTVIY